MRLLPLTSCLLLLTSASAQVAQLRWDVQVDRPVPHDFPVWQGETVDLMPRLVQGTAPVAVTNSPVEFRYREAALAANVYRYVTAEPNTNTGVLAVRWIPDYDAGAAFYDYQVIVGSNAANPRAFGRITMRPTIGWQASTSPPPAILHYATAAQVQAASNALADALHVAVAPLATTQSVAEVAGDLGTHEGRTDNPHTVTAAQLGALTNETDTAALAALAAHSAYWPPNATARDFFTFTTNNGAITITGYNIAGGMDVIIPDYINGWPVTKIGVIAFVESGVTSISGAGNVVTVGYSAFGGCTLLASVSLPQVQTVEDFAFYGCTLLASVSLPQVQTVGKSAFGFCGRLTSLYFNGNAPTIGADIFANITPNQVTNYVTNPQATGWGDTLGGMPVVRLPLYADKIYQDGELVATTGHVAQAIAAMPVPDMSSRVAVSSGTATNLTTRGWFALPQTVAGTNLTYRLVVSNDVILAIGVWE